MTVKALKNQLMAAIAMTLVAAVALGSSTFAWFAANSTVTVSGMTVTTQVDSNLLISGDNVEANYGTSLIKNLSAKLQPTSTINGINYFWNAADNTNSATGAAKAASYTVYNESTSLSDTGAGKTAYDADFNTANGVTAPAVGTVKYGYVDYEFYLKAQNVTASTLALNMTKCNLLYNDAVLSSTDKAWRVAVLAHEAVANTPYTTAYVADDEVSILAPASAAYFDTNKAVKNASSTDTVAKLGSSVKIDDVPATSTKYYKVTVRLWIEGEDDSCNNSTYAANTANYKLNLEFSVDTAKSAVSGIGSAVAS